MPSTRLAGPASLSWGGGGNEVDTSARTAREPSITRDGLGEACSKRCLKIWEGTRPLMPPQGGRQHTHQEFIQIDHHERAVIVGRVRRPGDSRLDRVGTRGIGFGAEVYSQGRDRQDRTTSTRYAPRIDQVG